MSTPSKAHPHRTVVVAVGNHRAAIDVGVAPLIREVWCAGLRTLACCQEVSSGTAWVEFAEVDDLKAFLNIVAVFESGAGTVYDRAVSYLCHPAPAGRWEYTLTPHDGGGCADGDELEGRPVDFYFAAGVYLPRADLPVVVARLAAHNRRRTRRERKS